ncbi:unnamed protein product [Spirodela intermedia]|uniref:RNA methyltransferase n=1 Tax=Spirodela intermedia TaxID=51605 RepID=A0A7I8KJB0_SPIIN|nr:unnamed protein product [Spirodela intermedia]
MTEKGEKNSEKRKKRKESFIYGNYRCYYSYRIDRKLSEDPRLTLMKKEWFEGKDCLDIGCNQGLITINIANKFCCRKILGIDIDPGLIEAARWNLRRIARAKSPGGRLMETSKPLISNGDRALDHHISQSTGEDEVRSSQEALHPIEGTLLERVSFRAENIIETTQASREMYDTILCLSVTKWIHLNWGDEGLISLFVKIWRLLRPGGILLLEPQPWSSYKSNKRVSEVATLNYSRIAFTPDVFQEILLDKIGFRSMEDISGSLAGTVTGFNRPIFVLRK